METIRLPITAALLVLTLLAASDATTLAGGPGRHARVQVGPATLAVAGPPGFCLDAPATRIDRDGAFVLLGDCGLLGKGPAAARPQGAVLTASLEAGGAGSVAGIGRLTETAAGRALVSQSGSGARVKVLATREAGGAVFLLVEDQGRKPVPGLKSRFWRGFLDIDGHLAVVSMLAIEGGTVEDQQGLTLAVAFAEAMQAANAQ